MPSDAVFGDEDESVQKHTQEAITTTETDAHIATDRAAAALVADGDDALERQPREDAAVPERTHGVPNAAQDAAAAEHAVAPTASQPAKLEPEPSVISQAPQATPSAVDDRDVVPPADSMEAAPAQSDAAPHVASVPAITTMAAPPADTVSAASDDQMEPPGGGEPAQADFAADVDHPLQPLADLSALALEAAEAAAEASGPPAPSAESEAAAEQGIESAELADALPTLSTLPSEARLHSTEEPPADGSEDPSDPTADNESADASDAAVGSTAEDGAEAAEPSISDDVAHNKVDVAVVLPEKSSAGVSLPDGPSADDVPAEIGSRSLSSAVELLPEDNLSADPTMVGASPVQRATVGIVSETSATADAAQIPAAEHSEGVVADAG